MPSIRKSTCRVGTLVTKSSSTLACHHQSCLHAEAAMHTCSGAEHHLTPDSDDLTRPYFSGTSSTSCLITYAGYILSK